MGCGGLAKMVGDPNLRVGLGVVLLGGGGGLRVGSNIVRLTLRVSSCGGSRISQCVLWGCHRRGGVGSRP